MPKLAGTSLIYTLMILLIIGSLLGVLVVVNGLQGQYENRVMGQVWARHNLQSGVNQFLADMGGRRDVACYASTTTCPLFDQGLDSISLQTENWGMLGLIHTRGIYGNFSESKSCLFGQAIPKDQSFSLWLADQGSPLALAGKIHLGGKLYLPKAGINPTFLNGKSYQGPSSWPNIQDSRSIKIRQDRSKWQEIKGMLSEIRSWQLNNEYYQVSELEVSQDWKGEAYELQSASKLLLDDVQLKGKCLIQANEVILSPRAKLEHCLIFAKKLTIQSGFEGSLQAFVLEELEVESEVKLSYPSLLALLPDSNKDVRLVIQENSELEAQIILSRDVFKSLPQRNDKFLIEENTHIWGTVFSSQALDLRGYVHGRVITDQFVYHTPARLYRNYLVDVYIDSRDLSDDYVGILGYPDAPYRIVEWLEDPSN